MTTVSMKKEELGETSVMKRELGGKAPCHNLFQKAVDQERGQPDPLAPATPEP